jgi:hypothetical protein
MFLQNRSQSDSTSGLGLGGGVSGGGGLLQVRVTNPKIHTEEIDRIVLCSLVFIASSMFLNTQALIEQPICL